MDAGCGFGPRDWGCYHEPPPFKNNLGLELMSTAGVDRITKGLVGNSAFVQRDCVMIPMPNSIPVDFPRDGWMLQRERFVHMLPMHQPNYAPISDSHVHMIPHLPQQIEPEKDDKQIVQVAENGNGKVPPKKRSAGGSGKTPKPKKPKKANSPKESCNGAVLGGKPMRKSVSMSINGLDLDISALPAPVCTCTGMPHQCYRWGVGGWQSACCTTTLSTFPLPMSQKRRGARIAGRKMSQGAFKKVLEKLVSEGFNLSDAIDLRPYWAKHGTNKFVTIR